LSGGAVADVPDIPGRGYARIGHLPLSVQIAQLFVEPEEDQSDYGRAKADLLKPHFPDDAAGDC
jgi:hypothetical protein